MPHTTVLTLIGGLCPTAVSTATPCPFWTTSTVIASGITNATVASQVNSGAVKTGEASTEAEPGEGE